MKDFVHRLSLTVVMDHLWYRYVRVLVFRAVWRYAGNPFNRGIEKGDNVHDAKAPVEEVGGVNCTASVWTAAGTAGDDGESAGCYGFLEGVDVDDFQDPFPPLKSKSAGSPVTQKENTLVAHGWWTTLSPVEGE
jgi:hypothetical protein